MLADHKMGLPSQAKAEHIQMISRVSTERAREYKIPTSRFTAVRYLFC